MKKKLKENKKFRLIAMALITVLIVAGFSYAWFWMKTTDADQMFSVSNFQTSVDCYFMVNDTRTETASYEKDGLIVLSVDKSAENYIGNFRVDVICKGSGSGYLRVKMAHEYNRGTLSTQHPAEVSYTVNTAKWADNRSNDYCYYYKDVLDADNNGTINLIQGISENADAEFAKMSEEEVISEIRVAVEADMVQVNRYPQVWGIEKLPWK